LERKIRGDFQGKSDGSVDGKMETLIFGDTEAVVGGVH
jgi:hypothetical protein